MLKCSQDLYLVMADLPTILMLWGINGPGIQQTFAYCLASYLFHCVLKVMKEQTAINMIKAAFASLVALRVKHIIISIVFKRIEEDLYLEPFLLSS